MNTVEERVQAGAEWLDRELGPDWVNLIDLDALDMSDCKYCVLGQTFGNYWESRFVREFLDADADLPDEIDPEQLSAQHGFNTKGGEDYAAFGALGAAWRRLIESRRGVSA